MKSFDFEKTGEKVKTFDLENIEDLLKQNLWKLWRVSKTCCFSKRGRIKKKKKESENDWDEVKSFDFEKAKDWENSSEFVKSIDFEKI